MTLMVGSITSPEIKSGFQKSEKKYPGIQFEPADHPTDGADYKRLEMQIRSGNLRVHAWNEEVALRVAKYAPVILTLDGQAPFLSPQDGPFAYDEKYTIWRGLPDRPNKINLAGKLYVIAGDLDWGLKSGREIGMLPLMGRNIVGKSKTEDIIGFIKEACNLDADEVDDVRKGEIGEAIGEGAIVFSLALLIHKAIAQASSQSEKSAGKSHGITRRTFLKGVGSVLTIGALAGVRGLTFDLPKGMASIATDQETKQYWLNIAGALKPIIKHNLVNTRTALLISKTEDTIERLGLSSQTPACVLMGSTHSFEANALMNDRGERFNTILGGTNALLKALDIILEKYPTIPKNTAKNNLLDFIARTKVMVVTDPRGPDQNPNLMYLIDENIHELVTFQSTQVESAINQLRSL